jgi:hypothetical protein
MNLHDCSHDAVGSPMVVAFPGGGLDSRDARWCVYMDQ